MKRLLPRLQVVLTVYLPSSQLLQRPRIFHPPQRPRGHAHHEALPHPASPATRAARARGTRRRLRGRARLVKLSSRIRPFLCSCRSTTYLLAYIKILAFKLVADDASAHKKLQQLLMTELIAGTCFRPSKHRFTRCRIIFPTRASA